MAQPTDRTYKKWFRILRWIAYAYVLIGIALYFLQDYFMFHPEPLDREQAFNFNIPYEERFIAFNETDTMCLLHFTIDTARTQHKGSILYFHGNRKNVQHYAPFVPFFTARGYDVWMPDYPGFGKSTGKRTERKMYQQAWQVFQLARQWVSADSLIIYGKSLGTGVAAYLASETACKRLILETPYYSMPELFRHYAPIYPAGSMAHNQFPTYQYIQATHMPISIFHGTDDGVIPIGQARRLIQVAKPGDELIVIPGGSHNDLASDSLYQHKLDSLLR
jgi:alpha-beta hydrolase superfamily lysophospholipase